MSDGTLTLTGSADLGFRAGDASVYFDSRGYVSIESLYHPPIAFDPQAARDLANLVTLGVAKTTAPGVKDGDAVGTVAHPYGGPDVQVTVSPAFTNKVVGGPDLYTPGTVTVSGVFADESEPWGFAVERDAKEGKLTPASDFATALLKADALKGPS